VKRENIGRLVRNFRVAPNLNVALSNLSDKYRVIKNDCPILGGAMLEVRRYAH
jgi:hypothetical protein